MALMLIHNKGYFVLVLIYYTKVSMTSNTADQTTISMTRKYTGKTSVNNIGIKHIFSYINIRQVPWEVLKTEAGGTWRMLMH